MTDTPGGKTVADKAAVDKPAVDKPVSKAAIGNPTDADAGNTAVTSVPAEAPHDRVQMLSLHADGTPNQLNPEIIGDKDAALKGARTQFAEQAVSAADVATGEPSNVTLIGQADGTSKAVPATRDAVGGGAVELASVREEAQAAGVAAADAAIDRLHRG